MKKKIYSFSLDPELMGKIQKIARDNLRSASNMVETILINKLNLHAAKAATEKKEI